MRIILQNTPYIPKRRKEAMLNVKKRGVLFRRQGKQFGKCCRFAQASKQQEGAYLF